MHSYVMSVFIIKSKCTCYVLLCTTRWPCRWFTFCTVVVVAVMDCGRHSRSPLLPRNAQLLFTHDCTLGVSDTLHHSRHYTGDRQYECELRKCLANNKNSATCNSKRRAASKIALSHWLNPRRKKTWSRLSLPYTRSLCFDCSQIIHSVIKTKRFPIEYCFSTVLTDPPVWRTDRQTDESALRMLSHAKNDVKSSYFHVVSSIFF